MSAAGNPSAQDPVLHGGARRLEMRWQNLEGQSPVQLSRYEIWPGEACSPHVHTGKVETWVFVAGHGVARVGGRSFAVRAGDALVTHPGTPHAVENTGEEKLVFLNIVLPTGREPITTRELPG